MFSDFMSAAVRRFVRVAVGAISTRTLCLVMTMMLACSVGLFLFGHRAFISANQPAAARSANNLEVNVELAEDELLSDQPILGHVILWNHSQNTWQVTKLAQDVSFRMIIDGREPEWGGPEMVFRIGPDAMRRETLSPGNRVESWGVWPSPGQSNATLRAGKHKLIVQYTPGAHASSGQDWVKQLTSRPIPFRVSRPRSQEAKARALFTVITQRETSNQTRLDSLNALLTNHPDSKYLPAAMDLGLARLRGSGDFDDVLRVAGKWQSIARQTHAYYANRIAWHAAEAAYMVRRYDVATLWTKRCNAATAAYMTRRISEAQKRGKNEAQIIADQMARQYADDKSRAQANVEHSACAGKRFQALIQERNVEIDALQAKLNSQWPLTSEEQKMIPTDAETAAELTRLSLAGKIHDFGQLPEVQAKTLDLPENRQSMNLKIILDALKKVLAKREKEHPESVLGETKWLPHPESPELKYWAEYADKKSSLSLTPEEQARLAKIEASADADGTRTAAEWQRLIDEVDKIAAAHPQPQTPNKQQMEELQALNRRIGEEMKKLPRQDAERIMLLKRQGVPGDAAHLRKVLAEIEKVKKEKK